MADTLPAVKLTDSGYQSCVVLSGIAAGTSISIQNQTTGYVHVAISATQPVEDFIGELIPPKPEAKAYISAGENTVWLKGDGPVSIQAV